MHLHGKCFARVEQFDQEWKTRGVGDVAKNFAAMILPKFMQTLSAQRAVTHDALCFGPVDDFPRFTDAQISRQFFPVNLLQAPPAPDALHEQRFEHERIGDLQRRHGANFADQSRSRLNLCNAVVSVGFRQ